MIHVTDLTKSYGSTVVLDHIDFHVEARQIAAVVGPSGAGKSTLARCLNLLERPSSGRIEIAGQDLTRLRSAQLRSARREIGTVFQSANLLSRLTVAQNVELPLRNTAMADDERYQRVHYLLDRVGLLHRASNYPAQLSGGQRQRVGIARGLALQPDVLLADEATSGLDPDSTIAILDLILQLRDEFGLTVVLITHEMDVVRRVADSVAFLDKGHILEHGPVAELVRRSDSPLSRALLPLPAGVRTPNGMLTWRLRYDAANIDTAWASTISRTLQTDVSILSALVEIVSDESVGRVTVGLDEHLDDTAVIAAFARCGLAASRDDTAPASKAPPVDLAAVLQTAS